MKAIRHDPMSHTSYEAKRFWQRRHEPICSRLPVLCGSKYVIYRSRKTGTYYTEGTIRNATTPITYDQTIHREVVDRNVARAIDFMKEFAQGKCVISLSKCLRLIAARSAACFRVMSCICVP
jgi:hypothetical protein